MFRKSITNPCNWFMLYRLREGRHTGSPIFSGPVEADESEN